MKILDQREVPVTYITIEMTSKDLAALGHAVEMGKDAGLWEDQEYRILEAFLGLAEEFFIE